MQDSKNPGTHPTERFDHSASKATLIKQLRDENWKLKTTNAKLQIDIYELKVELEVFEKYLKVLTDKSNPPKTD